MPLPKLGKIRIDRLRVEVTPAPAGAMGSEDDVEYITADVSASPPGTRVALVLRSPAGEKVLAYMNVSTPENEDPGPGAAEVFQVRVRGRTLANPVVEPPEPEEEL